MTARSTYGIDERVEPAEPLDRRMDHALNLIVIEDVDLQADRAIADPERGGSAASPLAIAIGQHEACAGRREELRRRATEAKRAAGEQDDLSRGEGQNHRAQSSVVIGAAPAGPFRRRR